MKTEESRFEAEEDSAPLDMLMALFEARGWPCGSSSEEMTGEVQGSWTTYQLRCVWRPEDQGAWQNAGGGVIRPGAANTSPHLGDEVDFQIMWKPNKPLSFLAGYAIFLPGSFISQTGQDPIAHFFYLQARAKF